MNYAQQANELANLTAPALLGLIVIVLTFVVIHLYKKAHYESQEKFKKMVEAIQESRELLKMQNTISTEQIKAHKYSADQMAEFIKLHCAKVSEKLNNVENEIYKISGTRRIEKVQNSELRKEYQKRGYDE